MLAFVSVGFAAETFSDEVASAADQANFAWADLVQPPRTSDDEQLLLKFATYREALTSSAYDEAVIAAKQMVRLVIASDASNLLARARALQNVAVAQQLQGDHSSAISNYRAAIDAVVKQEGRLSTSLIMPLRGLAIAYQDTDQPGEAFSAFERSLHINNVTAGPHNVQQLPILKSMMQFYLKSDDPGSASAVFDRIYQIYSRNYQGDTEELLPALLEQADFYGQINMYSEQRAALIRVLKISQVHKGPEHLSLIDLNLRIARNYIAGGNRLGFRTNSVQAAIKYLNDALSVAENNADADWKMKKRCLLALADYHILLRMYPQANRYYQRAWQLMSSDAARLTMREADLESTVPLSQPSTNRYANFEFNPDRDKIDPDEYLPGEMVVTFTVTRQGRARNLQFAGSQPPDFERMEWRVRNTLRRFVYRPRFAEGVPVEVSGQQYRLKYYYLPSEYAASRARSGK